MAHTFMRIGENQVRVNQSALTTTLCFLFKLAEQEASTIDAAQQYSHLCQEVIKCDEAGNGVMHFPFNKLIASGELSKTSLVGLARAALDYLAQQEPLISANVLRSLGMPASEIGDVYRDVMREILENIVAMASR